MYQRKNIPKKNQVLSKNEYKMLMNKQTTKYWELKKYETRQNIFAY